MFDKLNSVVKQIFKTSNYLSLGAIPQDSHLEAAVMQQMPVSMQSPNSKSCQGI